MPEHPSLPDPRPLTPDQISMVGSSLTRKTVAAPAVVEMGGPPPANPPRLLLIDDNSQFLATTEATWEAVYRPYADLEFFHFTAARRDELFQLLRDSIDDKTKNRFQTVYIDLNLSESGAGGGIGLIEALHKFDERLKFTPFVIVTASADMQRELESRRVGAIRFFTKTASHENIGGNIRLGTFVQRMIAESQETFEQLEDLIWAEASSRLAGALLHSPWKQAFRDVIDFIHDNYDLHALYARHSIGGTIFEQINTRDNLNLGVSELDIREVPFIKQFLDSGKQTDVIEKLTAKQTGSRHQGRLKDYQVAIARVAVRSRNLGFLTIYRPQDDRPFRRQDAMGLSRLADQLSGSILQEEEHKRQRKRELQMLTSVRSIDAATDEKTIFEALRDGLYESFATSIEFPEKNLESSIRRIDPGKNTASRPCNNRGYVDYNPEREVHLENYTGSSVSAAIWKLQGILETDLDPAKDSHFMFTRSDISSAITVPIVSQGVCVGAAILECLIPNAFDDQDLKFTEALCECAAAAILRLRTKAFLDDLADLALKLAEPTNYSTPDLIRLVCGPLLKFTGASEIVYFERPENAGASWRLVDGYRYPNDKIEEGDLEDWRQNIAQDWDSTYVHSVLGSGADFKWTTEPNEIPINDEIGAGRADEQFTRTQAVIAVRDGPGGAPEAIISLLFLHRHAIGETYMPILRKLSGLLSALLRQKREHIRLFGLNTIREQEARIGQMISVFRHNIESSLSLIRQHVLAAESAQLDWPSAAERIKAEVSELGNDITRNRYMVKVPEYVEVDIAELWHSTARQLGGVAAETGGSIEGIECTNPIVVTDPDILQTILFNLADNALRHGGVATKVSADVKAQGKSIRIAVSDTGKGIHPDMRDRLFEPGKTTGRQSTGMGLYLSRERSQDLGGNLTLASSDAEGTQFILTLPLKRQ